MNKLSHLRLSHLLWGTAAAAAVGFALPALAGGEAGRLALRDVGAKFVGYTTEPGDNGSLNVQQPDVRPVHAAGGPQARVSARDDPRRRRAGHRLARDARWARRLGRLFRRGRLGRVRRRPPGPRPLAKQPELPRRQGRRREQRDHLAALDLRSDRLARRRADADEQSRHRLDRELDHRAVLRRRARGAEDFGAARRDRPRRAARALGGRRQHVPRAGPEREERGRHRRVRGCGRQSGRAGLQQFAAADHDLEDRAGAAAGLRGGR